MKKMLLALTVSIAVLASSCKKDDPDPIPNNTVTLRYEFSADVSAAYDIKYTVDTSNYYETFVGQSWTKTVTVTKANANQTDSASMTVFPPPTWVGTTLETNANVKIFVNGVQKASNSAVLAGFDRPSGLSTNTNF